MPVFHAAGPACVFLAADSNPSPGPVPYLGAHGVRQGISKAALLMNQGNNSLGIRNSGQCIPPTPALHSTAQPLAAHPTGPQPRRSPVPAAHRTSRLRTVTVHSAHFYLSPSSSQSGSQACRTAALRSCDGHGRKDAEHQLCAQLDRLETQRPLLTSLRRSPSARLSICTRNQC